MKLNLLILAFVFLYNTNLCSEEIDKKLHSQCLYPTIAISSLNYSGTGVVIRSDFCEDHYKNVFLTSAHNLPCKFSIFKVHVFKYTNWSECDDYETYPCCYYHIDEKQDIAIGMFESALSVNVATLTKNYSPYIGNDVFKIGCGDKKHPRLDCGKLTSVKISINDLHMYRISIYTIFGDSGGPIYNSNYELVALTNSISINKGNCLNNISFGTPLKNIGDKLDIINKKEKMPVLPFYFLKFNELKEIK